MKNSDKGFRSSSQVGSSVLRNKAFHAFIIFGMQVELLETLYGVQMTRIDS